MEYIIEEYDLSLIDCDDKSCKTELSPKHGKALLKERRKLYIVHYQNEILYVGEANNSLKTRFQRGCVSFNYYAKHGEARKGYKGYKWLNKENNIYRELSVCVAIFDYKYDDNRSFIEAVEGELVYLIRKKFDYWPKFQNEIHFNNCNKTKEIAEEILAIISLDR